MHERKASVIGRGAVGWGGALLALSVLMSWFPERTGLQALRWPDALLLLFGVATLVLAAISAARQTLIPLLYARLLGLCALVTIVYGVASVGAGPVRWGVLVAGLAAAMIVGGASAALSDVARSRAAADR